jgi:probable rRNA maturation factor
MFSLQILSHPEFFTLDEARLAEICQHVSQVVDIPQSGVLNIAFLSDDEIRVLNHQYRGIDSTTDVLSFHYFDDFADTPEGETAGEIIMSESRVLSQSIDHGHSPTAEFETLIIHGMLHILGYDHETDDDFEEMWKIEKPIRDKFNLT